VRTEPQQDILLVEDNSADVLLLQHAVLKYGQPHWRLYRVADGEAALAFLRQEGMYAGMPCPDLVIIDIGLPKRDGWEVLAAIRAIPSLSALPVVMLTGIILERDREQRTALHPSACFEKPLQLEGYRQLVGALAQLLRTMP
jgi:two-component system response regulator